MSWGIKKWEGKGSCGQVSHVPHLFPPFYAPIWVSVPPLITKRLRYRLNGSEQRIKVKRQVQSAAPERCWVWRRFCSPCCHHCASPGSGPPAPVQNRDTAVMRWRGPQRGSRGPTQPQPSRSDSGWGCLPDPSLQTHHLGIPRRSKG